jgi:hypothetical protein
MARNRRPDEHPGFFEDPEDNTDPELAALLSELDEADKEIEEAEEPEAEPEEED